jgi:hypothetical protein
MTHTTSAAPSLLPELAFVVQFREGTDLEHGPITGRAEHITSGQAARFQSLDELVAFMTRVLTTLRAPPQRPSLREEHQ